MNDVLTLSSPYGLLVPGQLVYVAGAYSSPTAWGRRRNVIRAVRVGLRVMYAGATPVIPHSMFHPFFGSVDESEIIRAGLELLWHCSAIMVLPGWQDSNGTKGEIAEARSLCIDEIFLTENDL
jgi:hypothetical protein